jgi:uncharacterized membrane protein
MPNWSDIHPALVHFPIAFLFIAPLFLVIGAIFKKQDFKTTFLILLLLGTLSIILATATGEAAGEKITVITDALLETLDHHESSAERSKTIFIILSIAAIAWHFFRTRASIIPSQIKSTAISLFVCLYGFGLLTLSTAAHHGGGLVHHHGVHSDLFKETQ